MTNQKIKIIINGQDYLIDANVNEPLIEVVKQALNKSNNTGRELDEWEIRDASGIVLEKNRTPKALGLVEDVRLFLSIAIGAGGINEHESSSL